MIRRIAGTLTSVETEPTPFAELTPEPGAPGGHVSGFGLAIEVAIPRSLADRLEPRVGERIELHTKLFLEQSAQQTSFAPRLLGFASAADRQFFEQFTSVKGVGPRAALKALVVDPADVAAAITAKDAKALTKLPGIGKRTAETIIAALHGKVAADPEALARAQHAVITDEPKIAPTPATGPVAEAIEALVALGETRGDAERKIGKAAATIADARSESAEPTTDDLVNAAFGHYHPA